jgi:hypothetical protein
MSAGSILHDKAVEYLERSGDRQSKFWVFKSSVPSKFLRRSFSCGPDDLRIQITDLFGGRQPILLNYEALTREIQIPFRPTVVMDSNIVSYLHQYVGGDSSLSAQKRRAVLKFLQFVVSRRFDYNPFFYYMEAAWRSAPSSLVNYATEISVSLLRLHTMQVDCFLNSGEIRVDPRLLAIYEEEYRVTGIAELASAYARSMIQPTDPRMEWISKLAYAALLKTALIHKLSKRGVHAKYEELQVFMEQTFNVALGVERLLALEYFVGKFDAFIPVQRGAGPNRVLDRLRAASWDLLLLHLPAFLLVADIRQEVLLGYVCTGDKTLNLIAKACRIDGVVAFAPDVHVPLPVMTYDISALEADLGRETAERIRASDERWQKDRASRLSADEKHISFEELDSLILRLEDEVAGFCRG